MKKDYPNPGETFKKNPPVVASATDATGVAPNMPPRGEVAKELGDIKP